MIYFMQHQPSGLVLIQARDRPYRHLKVIRAIKDAPQWAVGWFRLQFEDNSEEDGWQLYHPLMLTISYLPTVPPAKPATPRFRQLKRDRAPL